VPLATNAAALNTMLASLCPEARETDPRPAGAER
jgi:hypothetical protein